jgi:hypothetical protein
MFLDSSFFLKKFRKRCQHFLISYYEDAEEYERAFVLLNKHPEMFEELQQLEPVRNVMVCSMVDYFTTLDLSRKFSLIQHPAMVEMLKANRKTRRDMYERHLPLEKFAELDKACWNKMSLHLAKLTNSKHVIQYPYK